MNDPGTAPDLRPRRSLLYVPGSNARALEKSAALDADAVIFDLEDAVLPEAKVEARTRVLETLEAGRHRAERIVRVNGVDEALGRADLEALAGAEVDAVLLPKVESPETILEAQRRLDAGGGAAIKLMAMIETPLGVLEAPAIAGASDRMAALVVGANDLEAHTGAKQSPDRLPMLMALSRVVFAARAHGLSPIDAVHPKLDDEAGLLAVCRQGAELGFDGKTVIHPKQIGPANEAFAPSDADIAKARSIVEAFEVAQAEGRGVVVVDGQMIEALHVRMAQRMVAVAERIAGR